MEQKTNRFGVRKVTIDPCLDYVFHHFKVTEIWKTFLEKHGVCALYGLIAFHFGTFELSVQNAGELKRCTEPKASVVYTDGSLEQQLLLICVCGKFFIFCVQPQSMAPAASQIVFHMIKKTVNANIQSVFWDL